MKARKIYEKLMKQRKRTLEAMWDAEMEAFELYSNNRNACGVSLLYDPKEDDFFTTYDIDDCCYGDAWEILRTSYRDTDADSEEWVLPDGSLDVAYMETIEAVVRQCHEEILDSVLLGQWEDLEEAIYG